MEPCAEASRVAHAALRLSVVRWHTAAVLLSFEHLQLKLYRYRYVRIHDKCCKALFKQLSIATVRLTVCL